MKAAFIDKTRVERKSIVSLKMEQLGPRPENMAVQLGLSIKDEQAKLEYAAGEYLNLRIRLDLHISDHDHPDFNPQKMCKEGEVFFCQLEIQLLIKIIAGLKLKNPVAEEYTHELLSLTYDDFRFIIEDSVSRSDFRGFYLPIDFREVLQGSTLTRMDSSD